MTKLFSVRFDVDTHRCARVGMPALSALGREMDAPFTFFVNMGKAVSRRTMLSRTGRNPVPVAAKLTAREKLGLVGYLWAAIRNPAVGGGAPGVLHDALAAGHELGLHGGTNHALWQEGASGWDRTRLAAELDAGLSGLVAALDGVRPKGFASPGWTTHVDLAPLLAERGFTYLADTHGPGPAPEGPEDRSRQRTASPPATDGTPDALPDVRTHLTGEPGGVAYLEHLRALGLDDTRILDRFERDLTDAGDIAVMYDHPYFAGVRELPLLRRLVERARALGYDVVPMHVVARRMAP